MKPRILSAARLTLPLALALAASMQAQTTGTWNYNGTVAASNSWSTTGSWTGLSGGQVPNAIAATPNLTFNITAARTITLDGDRTVGTLSIDDPTSGFFAYTLSSGTPSTSRLVFDVASGSAAINTPTAANTVTNVINAGITLNDPLVVTTTRTNVTGGLSLGGVITDGASSFSLTKNGNGALTLGAANDYDGGTTINGGRIQAGNALSFGTGGVTVSNGGQLYMATAATFANTISIAGSGYANTADSAAQLGAIRYQNSTTTGTITLAANARIGAFSGATGTIAGVLTGGARDLEINSTAANHSGNLVLTGNAAGLTGTVTVSQGTLRLGTASNLGGSLVVRDGANLYADNIGSAGGAVMGGSLTLGDAGSTTTGANFFVDPGSDDALLVSGNLTLNGINTVVLTGLPTTSQVVVMNYSGTLTGNAANLTLQGGLDAYRPGTGFTTTGNQVKLNLVTGDVTWTGAASDNWNTSEINWSDGSPTTYFNLDDVTFDDSASFTNVVLQTGVTVSPGSMTFNHSTVDYAVGGAGSISGGASLAKSGTGRLTITNANSFTGGTTLSAGTLRVGNAAAFGTGNLNLNGGKLSSDSATARTLTNPLNLSGQITLGDATDAGALTFSGATTLAADTTLTCDATNTVSHIISGSITDGAGSFRLTKGGSGHLILGSANSYDGGTTIEMSRIQANNIGALGSGTVTVLSGGQAWFNTGGTIGNSFQIEGSGWTEGSGNLGALRLQGGINLTGPVTLTGDARITAHGSTATLSGPIGETGGARALELGNYNTATDSTITVSGANTHSGGTLVKGATVIANTSSAFGSGPVTIESNGTAARITRVQLGTDVVIENDVVVNSSANTGFRGAVHSYSGSLATPSLAVVNGDIEIQGGVGNGGHLASESGSLSVLRVMGAVNVANTGIIPAVRIGTVELGGGGNYVQLNHNEGTLRLAASDGINPAARLNSSGSGATVFDLNGFNQTLAGLGKGSFGATITNGGAGASTLTLNLADASTYGGSFLSGAAVMNLVKTGTGILTLSGSSTSFLDNLTVTGGGLNLTGSFGAAASATSMAAGTVLSGEGTFGGDLTLSGTTIEVNGSSPFGIFATGDLDTSGGVSVNLQSLPATPGPIEVIAFGGTLAGSVGNFTLLDAGDYRNPQFQVNSNNVTLTFGAPSNLTWTGAGGNIWDTNTTSSWVDAVPGATNFRVGDNATFGNSGGGTVLVPDPVSTSAWVVNSNDNWSFEGAGGIQASSLTKDGTGLVNIATPWIINGPIDLAAGSLKFSTDGTIATALSGAGTLIKGGSGVLSITQDNSAFTGSAVISNGQLVLGTNTSLGTTPIISLGDAATLPTDVATLTLSATGALTTPVINVAATCQDARILSTGGTLSDATITKRGAGRLTIGHASTLGNTTNFVTGTSSITVEEGTLAGSSQFPISASTTITLGNANTGTAATIVELPANQTTTNDVVTMSSPLVLSADAPNSEAIFRYAGGTSQGSLSYNGPVTLNGRDIHFENTSNVNSPTRLYNVSGVISGNGNVRMRGNSGTTIRITGTANTFTGDVYIQTGRLQTGFSTTAGTEHIPNTALLIMSPGTTFALATTAETVRGLVGGAPTESIPTPAILNQGRGDTTLCRLTMSDSNAANTHVYGGTIANGNGTIGLTKAGAATQVLNGVNSYTGTTIVTGGTLEIGGAGQLGSGTYSSAITITSPGILKFNSTADQVLQTGVISGTGSLVKDNTGTLTLSGVNTFSGDITVNGGTLVGAGSQSGGGGVPVFGSRSNTRTITVNAGATLQFNSGNITASGYNQTTAPTLVIQGGTVTNGGIATNSALNNVELHNGTLTSTTGHVGSTSGIPVYGAWNLNGSVTSTGNSTISTTAPDRGWVMLKVVGDTTTDFNVTDGTLTVSAPVVDNPTDGNIGSLSKSGDGTMVLTAANTYRGNTTVNAGTLVLADDAQLKFVLGSGSGLNNSLTGTGTVTLNGDFVIDTAAADSLASGSWTLENVSTLTGAYGGTFSVVGFTDAGNHRWTKPNGQDKVYTFDETTGVLTLGSTAGYASWIGGFFPGETDPDIIGATADPDSDGIANAVEMVIGGDPKLGMDTALLPTVELVTDPVVVPAVPAGNYLLFTYRRTDLSVAAGLGIDCETNTGLGAPWTPATGAPGVFIRVDDNFVFSPPAAADTDRVRVFVPQGTAATLFGRLRGTVP